MIHLGKAKIVSGLVACNIWRNSWLKKMPSSNLKVNPHIESRYKLLTRQFHAINEMLNHNNGLEWNDIEKCITTMNDIFDDWMKVKSVILTKLNFFYPH